MTTTVAAIAALWFTSQSLRATNNQYDLSQQVAVTDRFQKAVAALTSDKVDIRLSGIYLLERLAADSPADYDTIFAVLSAFLRTHTSSLACETPTLTMPVPADAEAVTAVISRRGGHSPLDLSRTCLAGARLHHANLIKATFIGANLSQAALSYTDLTEARFYGATMIGTSLSFANLTRAELGDANLTGAGMNNADLADAWLGHANLTGALLNKANLAGADLTGANLTDANLTGANLAGAELSNVYYNEATRWPEGYMPPTSRLGSVS